MPRHQLNISEFTFTEFQHLKLRHPEKGSKPSENDPNQILFHAYLSSSPLWLGCFLDLPGCTPLPPSACYVCHLPALFRLKILTNFFRYLFPFISLSCSCSPPFFPPPSGPVYPPKTRQAA